MREWDGKPWKDKDFAVANASMPPPLPIPHVPEGPAAAPTSEAGRRDTTVHDSVRDSASDKSGATAPSFPPVSKRAAGPSVVGQVLFKVHVNMNLSPRGDSLFLVFVFGIRLPTSCIEIWLSEVKRTGTNGRNSPMWNLLKRTHQKKDSCDPFQSRKVFPFFRPRRSILSDPDIPR